MHTYRHVFRITGMLLLAFWLGGSVAESKVILPNIFGDNMVLQQKDKVQFFGKGSPNKKLTVKPSWSKKKYIAHINKDGNWKVIVPTPAAGKGFTVAFNDGEELLLKNVLVGEVWLASGQSNMQMPLTSWLGNVLNHEKEIAQANSPAIRFLQVEHVSSTVPLQDIKASKGWEICSPETVGDFSAVAYFFARNLHESLDVPIGIIHSSWGGTNVEAWISSSSLETIPNFVPELEKLEKNALSEEELLKQYEMELLKAQKIILAKDSGYHNGRVIWAANSLDDKDWKKMSLPGFWEAGELPAFDGIVWFRKKIALPEDWAGQDLVINIGQVDNDETTWFNGEEIGHTAGYDERSVYSIPARLVKAGENIISVRVVDAGGDGGIKGPQSEMFLSNLSGKQISLEGEWMFKVGLDFSSLPPLPRKPDVRNRLSGLYNAMVHPLLPVSMKGVIWYQGENNVGRANQYRELFPLLIKDWRIKFMRENLPFYFVQLANFKEQMVLPGKSDWAEIREAQLFTLSVPNTGMAVAIDAGEANDIHPKNKQIIGKRLALIARAQTYGENIVSSGPLLKDMKKEGNRIRLTFQHIGSGLDIKGEKALTGFAIAGEDRRFFWADARLEGDEVMVFSTEVANPVAVRYGWADNPKINLYNKEGLPASPFRTDNWSNATSGKKPE